MKQYEKEYLKDYVRLTHKISMDSFGDGIAYDFNEVQELLFSINRNNYVFLVGESGLRKKEMLERICQDLFDEGVLSNDCLYLDFELPILRNEKDIDELIFELTKRNSKNVYLIINEITQIDQWLQFVLDLEKNHPKIKLVCSATISYKIYEKMYFENLNYFKILVLSKKTISNIKNKTNGFGISNEFKYNIKDNVVEIKGLTSEGKKMKSLIIPAEIDTYPVKVISSGAFHDRSELEEIQLPDCIEQIGDYAFTNCINLKSINLPEALTYIGDNAFLGATKLESVNGGKNLKHIGCSAFFNTKWLNENKEDFITLGKVLYKYKGKDKYIIIDSSIKVLAPFSFADSQIEKIELDSIEVIEEGAFYNCAELQYITGIAAKSIGAYTFYGCKKLEIELNNIFYVGKYAFGGCNSIKKISFDNASIGACAFENCCNLSYIIGDIINVSIGAFANCNSLNHLNFKSMKEIGHFAFINTEIETCYLYEAINIGDYAFSNCNKIRIGWLQNAVVIGKAIFKNCKINTMFVSGKYKMRYYFADESNVKELFVKGDIVDNFNRNNHTLKILRVTGCIHFGKWSFYGNSSLYCIEFENVSNIGDWAFAYCNSITNIDLNQTINKLGMNSFRYCCNLKSIIIRANDVLLSGVNSIYATAENKTIYVKDSLLEKYKKNSFWKEYSKVIEKIKSDVVLTIDMIENYKKLIGEKIEVKMDRPIGTIHPKHPEIIYPINYGFVEGVMGGDGEEQDVYILGIDEPIETFTGKIIAVIHRFDDVESKWVVAPINKKFDEQQIEKEIHFQEQFHDIAIIV